MLRTVLGHGNKGDYGEDLRARVLRQLEVDRSTFDEVIRSGAPPPRPSPETAKVGGRQLDDFGRALLRTGALSAIEVLAMTAEEVKHIAMQLWSNPPTEDRGTVRELILGILEDFRSQE